MGIPIFSTCYCQATPSPPPMRRAKNLATVATKLPLNMSVTSLQDKKNTGKWQASLWPTRRSARQLSACLRSCPAKTGIPLPFSPFPSGTTTYWYGWTGGRADGRSNKKTGLTQRPAPAAASSFLSARRDPGIRRLHLRLEFPR